MPHPLGDLSYTWPFMAAAVLGYLLGSIPFGLILTRLAGQGDIRDIGSGNIGATNVLRTGHKGLAIATLVLDIGKGAGAALLGKSLGPDIMVLAAAGAFLGHLYPVWLKFKGGKGVATFVGVMLGINWPWGLACCGVWLVVAGLTRISSLAALAAALASPILAYIYVDMQTTELAGFLLILICLRHRDNVKRLLKGTEPRIGAN